MKKVFICHTYYHIFISMIKALKNPEDECDIMLSYTWRNNQLLNDKQIRKNLEKSKIFKKVITADFMSNELEKIKKNSHTIYIKKYFFMKKMKRIMPYNIKEYDDIYIFNDNSPIGLYLIYSHIYYNLLEDGTNCFINNKQIIKHKISIKKILKKIMKVYELGESKYAKTIEVNCKDKLFIKNKNIIENSKIQMISSLSQKEKNRIIDVFINNDKIKSLNGKTLIITQPLSEDEILKSETEKINIYKKIINDFCLEDDVAIKTHPREVTKYEQIFSDYFILNEIFPLELITYYDDIKLKKVITISSTSIDLIENAEQKITLGWDYLKK